MQSPQTAATAKIMPGAQVLGDVVLGAETSVWHNAVIRADVGTVRVGARSNIQDNSVLHMDDGGALFIGDDVTVGHACILHGCTIGSESLIGMGSIVLDGAVVGRQCVIGAGSLVTRDTVIPDGMLAFGRPAKVVRPLTEDEKEKNRSMAAKYAARAQKTNKGD